MPGVEDLEGVWIVCVRIRRRPWRHGHENRERVDGVDGDGDGGGITAAVAVADVVGEGVQTIEVGGGGVSNRLVELDDDGAADRLGGGGYRQDVAVDVRVIVKDGDVDRGVLVGKREVVDRDRCIVDGVDGDGDGGGGAAAVTIADIVSKGVETIEVCCRRVGNRLVEFDEDGAADRLGGGGDGQEIAVDVRIVVKDGDVDRGVLVGGGGIVNCQGIVVNGVDGDGDGGGGAPAAAVADVVSKGIEAVEVGGRGVSNRLVELNDDRTADRLGGGGDGQEIAVDIGVVVEDRDVDGCVLVGGGRIVPGDWRSIVDGVDGDGDCGGSAAAVAVADVVGEGIETIKVGGGGVSNRLVELDDDGTADRLGGSGNQ